MTLRTRLAVVAAALGVAAALPAYAGAETSDPGAPYTINFNVTARDSFARTVTGIVSCAAPQANGNQARFPVATGVEMYTVAVGNQVTIRVENGTIVQVSPQQPCASPVTPTPSAPEPSGDQPAPVSTGDDPGTGTAAPGDSGDTSGDGPSAPATKPGRDAHGNGNGGGKLPHFMRAFANRVWRFTGEANGFDNGQLDITVGKILNLPKRFASQDDSIVDQDAIALVGKATRVYDADGHRVAASQLDDANDVRVEGKLLAPKSWVDDEDGNPTTTIRAKRVVIVD